MGHLGLYTDWRESREDHFKPISGFLFLFYRINYVTGIWLVGKQREKKNICTHPVFPSSVSRFYMSILSYFSLDFTWNCWQSCTSSCTQRTLKYINLCTECIPFFTFQLNQAFLRELSEETGLTFSEEDLNFSTLGLWEVIETDFSMLLKHSPGLMNNGPKVSLSDHKIILGKSAYKNDDPGACRIF